MSAGHSMTMDELLKQRAVLSDCKQYRYWLKRDLNTLISDKPYVLYFMLNPSTADASVADPTVRKCEGFTRKLHAHTFGIINLFAKRTPYPEELFTDGYQEAVGPYNDLVTNVVLEWAMLNAIPVIAAWGSLGPENMHQRARDVLGTADSIGVKLKCLGLTKDGHPRHPLMLAYDSELADYEAPSAT